MDKDSIDPEVANFVAAILEGGAQYAELTAGSIVEQRRVAELLREKWRAGGPQMHRVRDLIAVQSGREVHIRLFEPDPSTHPRAALIYVHGGGFTLFSLDTHDRLMREYAARAGVLVVGVDYSLSPEARFPVALQEVVAVVDWVHANAGELGIDSSRIVIGGDSAGANLAFASCLVLRERDATDRIAGVISNYGFFDAEFDTTSARLHGGPGKLLTVEELLGFLDNYLGDLPRTDPLALPLLAELSDLPPSLHIIATCDPLADGNRAMVRRLMDAGNDVTFREYPGATHSFLEAVSTSSLAARAFADTSEWLRRLLQMS
ncbi:MAG: alpha/beta hydrolase fold domain-containing protein [Proteobacteria bacterium]|nr:alpha/beta hydrolase fold domain-containing protein [Pseudomonadota bacterium]